MNIKVVLLKSFGVNKDGGNPAGVVLNSQGLTDSQKMKISSIVGYSETAFVEPSTLANFKVTFFTPTEEVDLCGHATIATYSLLFQHKLIKPGKYTQELKAGVLGVEIDDAGLVTMEQTIPVFSEIIPLSDIQSVFGNVNLPEKLVPQVVSTGLRDIILPVSNRVELFTLEPNLEKMAALNRATNTIGFHVFTLDTIDSNSTAHCRNFAPAYGINEESATGSSNGALACYLYESKIINQNQAQNLKFEQGYSMNAPSEIFVSLGFSGDNINNVKVGGKAVIFGEKIIEL